MQRTVIETLMGAVVLAIAGLFLVFAYSSTDVRTGNGYDISASFNRIGGVKVGSPVRIGGISIGSVTRLNLDPNSYLAVVTMTVDKSYALPEDTTAAVASEGLLGGNFIELVPGGADELLGAGDEIMFTQDQLDVVQLLGEFIFSVRDLTDENAVKN